MKKLLTMLIIGLLFSFSAFAKKYKENDVVENQFYLSKKFQIDLPKGKWIIAEKSPWFYYGMSNTTYTLVKLKKNKLVEAISVVEWRTAGVHEDSINFALNEVMFKNKYHGCYDKPKYTVMEFYTKGSTHNCFWVGHHNFIKFIYDPEDPELSGSRTKIKQWISENQINLPKVTLYSEHSYFSRLAGGRWFQLIHIIDPKILNAPDNNFIKEDASEYHKYNIKNYPEHERIMKKWISISAQRHLDFENSINTKTQHRLKLNELSPSKSIIKENQSSNMIDQLQKLNDLFKSGVLNKKEFEKAKKKLLN
jgi:hypothetical protein